MGKRITKADRAILLRIYKQYKGKWKYIMEDEEIIATGHNQFKLTNHIAYLARKTKGTIKPSKTKKKPVSLSSEESEDSDYCSGLEGDSKEEDDAKEASSMKEGPEDEEVLVSITGRKNGRWYATYDDGDRRWLPRDCFVNSDDGTTNGLFTAFEKAHPGEDAVLPPLLPKSPVISKKRAIPKEEDDTVVLPRATKRHKTEQRHIQQELTAPSPQKQDTTQAISVALPKVTTSDVSLVLLDTMQCLKKVEVALLAVEKRQAQTLLILNQLMTQK